MIKIVLFVYIGLMNYAHAALNDSTTSITLSKRDSVIAQVAVNPPTFADASIES